MRRCFGIVGHTISDIDWPLQSVLYKPMVVLSTCYRPKQDLENNIGFMQDFRGRNCSALLSGTRTLGKCVAIHHPKSEDHYNVDIICN